MQLGTLLGRLSDESDAALALEALGDVVLFAEVQAMGERHEEAPGEYLANAARRFAARGSDEDWLGLMTAIERSDDPGRAVLARILRWALAADAAPEPAQGRSTCSCGSAGHGAP